jgi:hypothetical protein
MNETEQKIEELNEKLQDCLVILTQIKILELTTESSPDKMHEIMRRSQIIESLVTTIRNCSLTAKRFKGLL